MSETRQTVAPNRFDPEAGGALDPVTADLLERRATTFGPSSVLFYREPLHIVRAEGVFMYGADGKRYLDTYNNVAQVGHCHPRVVEAIAKQAAILNTNTRYLYDNIHDYAERLLETYPASLSNIVFTCTGSEANDIALRLARLFTGGRGFVVTETAYHGNTAAVDEISPGSAPGRELPPHIRAVPAPDVYRRPSEDISERFANEIEGAIGELEEDGIPFAGFIADSLFSSDGVYADPPGFLEPAIEVVHNAGGLFIGDEVQPGFGRTGSHMWSFQRHGVTPDIVTMGKPMGNGFPVAGVVTRPEILEPFCGERGYFNTFGGNPVAAAAGLAVLDVLEEEGLLENAERIGSYFRKGLDAMRQLNAAIGDVRSAGLFIGIELSKPGTVEPDPAMAGAVINAMKDEGVLIGAAGAGGNILKLRPPLCLEREHVDFFLEALFDVLQRESRQ